MGARVEPAHNHAIVNIGIIERVTLAGCAQSTRLSEETFLP
jgi:hypothetical protein